MLPSKRLITGPLILALLVAGIPTAVAVDTRLLDVVSVTWLGAQPSVTVTSVEIAINNEVSPRWKRYTTIEGSKENQSINFRHGVTLSAPIILTRPMACEGRQASSFMSSIRQEAYKRLGIENWTSRYLIILTPNAGCIWTGRALIGNIKNPGGVITLQDSSSAIVIVHELGHSLGLGHSNFLRCDSGRNDGPWGTDCKAVEYGGAIDVMSNVDVDLPLSTYSQWLLGYLDKDEVKQSWLSEEIFLNAADVAGGTRAIFLRDGKSTYWVEYRRATANSSYKPGLVIYRTDPPPTSSVVSPNPEDTLSPEFDEDLTTDLWMLNWDNYTYFRSRASGSMSLPESKTATVFTGNISLVASGTGDSSKIKVTVTRKADRTPPPVPEITDPNGWLYPGASIIKAGYDDGESAIVGFEADISGKIVEIKGSEIENLTPTYLNPLMEAKTVYLKDLPEGSYSLSIRAIDVWGNKSAWSRSIETYVDRGNPVTTSDFTIDAIDSNKSKISWNGVKDDGIGLCTAQFINPEGFVWAKSTDKNNPKFDIATGRARAGKIQVFDCLGNGMESELELMTTYLSPLKSRRTGKWSPAPSAFGAGTLSCSGKCSASISVSGVVQALIGSGSATISVAGKPPIQVPASSLSQVRTSGPINTGERNRVVRISGSDFVFAGLAKIQAKTGIFQPVLQKETVVDPSLVDPIQKEMSRFGFNSQDFEQSWSVLPMPRGTTLLDPTLDLCGANYASESGREARRQLSVNKVGLPYLFLSTESVKYKSVAAAEAALAELKKNYEACVRNKGETAKGNFTPYTFQAMPKSDAKLLEEKNRVVVRATIGVDSAARQLLAFYQFNGAYFTGLYIVLAGEKSIAEGEVLRWFEVAEVMAKRLVDNK